MAAGRSKNIYYRVPEILYEAWRVYGDAREITSIVEVSALVSTNQVFRLSLGDGTNVIAKVSSYGSYFQFREDHQRVHQWFQLLQDGPYDGFLSDSLLKNDDVYTYYDGAVWVIFYNDISIRSYLPRILAEQQIVELGEEGRPGAADDLHRCQQNEAGGECERKQSDTDRGRYQRERPADTEPRNQSMRRSHLRKQGQHIHGEIDLRKPARARRSISEGLADNACLFEIQKCRKQRVQRNVHGDQPEIR